MLYCNRSIFYTTDVRLHGKYNVMALYAAFIMFSANKRFVHEICFGNNVTYSLLICDREPSAPGYTVQNLKPRRLTAQRGLSRGVPPQSPALTSPHVPQEYSQQRGTLRPAQIMTGQRLPNARGDGVQFHGRVIGVEVLAYQSHARSPSVADANRRRSEYTLLARGSNGGLGLPFQAAR